MGSSPKIGNKHKNTEENEIERLKRELSSISSERDGLVQSLQRLQASEP